MDRSHRVSFVVSALAPLLVLAIGWLASGPRPVSTAAEAAAFGAASGEAYRWLHDLQRDFPRRPMGSAAQRGAIAFIASSLTAAGAQEVSLEAIRHGPRFLVNVLGVVPGRDRSRRVVLAAHHDTVSVAPGAIDDGGAIAAILAATRQLASMAARGQPPACDVQVAIFDGEERGLLGSKAHLERGGEALQESVKAAVAVELVGWKHDRLVVHTIPHGFAWDAEGIAPPWLPGAIRDAAAAATGSGAAPVAIGDPWISPWYQGTIRLLGVLTGSDAGAYSEVGLPAVMLTGSSLTNFYSAYHQPTDDMPQVDRVRLDEAAAVIAAAAVELAALEEAPPELGRAYLALGGRTLGRLALTLIGLATALGLVAAALLWRRAGEGKAGAACGGLAAAMALVALQPSVLGLVVGVPLACGVVAAGAAPPGLGRWALLFAGRLSLWIEVLLVAAASASFGFRWEGGALETASLALLVGSGLAAGALVRRAGREAPAAS